MSKYHNRKTEHDGILFDSKKEAERYVELKILLKAGLIRNLELQKSYELIPAQMGERACSYRADFSYEEKSGDDWIPVVEDVKGMRTDVYKIKRKLMLYKYGIEIREI